MKNPLVRDLSVVGIAILVCVSLAAAFSLTRDKVAPAQANLVLSEVRTPNLANNTTLQARVRIADEVLRAKSNSVFQAAADELGITLAELRSTVAVRQDDDATAIVIEGKAPTLAVSIERANTVASAYEAAVRQSFGAGVAQLDEELARLAAEQQSQIENIQAELAVIDAALAAEAQASTDNASSAAGLQRNLTANSTERANLASEANAAVSEVRKTEARRETIQSELALFDGGIAFASPADSLSGPVEPRTTRNVLLAAAAGLLIGLGIAWSIADAGRE